MRYLLDKNKRYVISTEVIFDNRLKFYDAYKQIYIYEMNVELVDSFISKDIVCIRYLDIFLVIIPQLHDMREKLWTCFYEYFGEMYDSLINKENNLACIDWMIKYIEHQVCGCSPLVLLDYGCGNGISASLGCKHILYGYEPIEIMSRQARLKGMEVYDDEGLQNIPNNFFDGVFSSYVFHLSLCEEDILKIFPKMKENTSWIVNYYKGINEEYMNEIFFKNGFTVQKILGESGRFGSIYEYRKRS